jgi:hypothetical protein
MDTFQLALPESEEPIFGPVIYAYTPELRGYTRAQAIADGVLVDVTETAEEVGFRHPVAITEPLHNRLTPTKADQAIGQDYDGRLWDALWLAAFTIKLEDPSASLPGLAARAGRAGSGMDTVSFTVELQEVDVKSGQPKKVNLRLRAVCGLGDEGDPVVTIGFPEDFLQKGVSNA